MNSTNDFKTYETQRVNFLRPNSKEWKVFIKRLELTTKKSNRDSLCVECWRVYPQESRARHQKLQPNHVPSILTSKYFASEEKFINLAQNLEKFRVRNNEVEYQSPFKTKWRKYREIYVRNLVEQELSREKTLNSDSSSINYME